VDGGSTATYQYDAYGRRVHRAVGTVGFDYIYDAQGRMIGEIDAANSWNRVYIYTGAQLIAEYLNGTTEFIHADRLGSTRLLTGMSQPAGSLDNLDYLPFGEQIAGGTGTSHKFTGKERDSESGNDNFGARYYSSSLGRFMSPDPYNSIVVRQGMKAGGLPEAAVHNFFNGFLDQPQNWNKYIYALNNPLRFVDPTGAAPQDGHHLIPDRENLGALGRAFTDAIKTGPLSGNGIPNQPGFNVLHRAYNDAVKELLNETVKEEGPSEEWSIQQWKDFANSVLKSEEPAIKEFLDELEENNPGAKATLTSSIATYRVTANVIARVVVSSLFRNLFRILILCVNCDQASREMVTWRFLPPRD
jgi:RHS repeat-associated protein